MRLVLFECFLERKKKKKRSTRVMRLLLFKCFLEKERKRKIRDPIMEQRTNKGDGSRNCY